MAGTLRPIILASALALVGGATEARAQTAPEAAVREAWPGRVEVGASVALFTGADRLLTGPQVTINFSRRGGLQLSADTYFDRRPRGWRILGMYTALYRYSFVDRPGGRAFVLAGAGGLIHGSHDDAYSTIIPARTIIRDGVPTTIGPWSVESAAYTRWQVRPPELLTVGLGADARVARHLIVQGQATLAFTAEAGGLRLAAGVGVPLGRVTR